MLWNEVFEFFVKYVFGGYLGDTYYESTLGGGFVVNDDEYYEFFTNTYPALKWTDLDGYTYSLCLGNYLSLIATIITMVVIILFMCFIIKKIIGIIFRLFTGSSSF